MSTLNILIVDDKKENLESATAQFSGKDVVIMTAPTFEMAVQLLGFHTYDIVLTDLMLPGEPEGVSSTNPAIGQDTPYGLVLAIMARNKGIEHVAIVTDLNHHSSPIAWAMDQLLGNHSFISTYGDYKKNWLQAAEAFIAIPEKGAPRMETGTEKKVLMLAGMNDEYKLAMQEELQNSFDIVFVSEKQPGHVLPLYADKKPDVIIVIGELDENSGRYNQTRLFRNLKKAHRANQRVFIMGFMENDTPEYLRLPISGDNLRQKLGLASAH